MPAPPRFSILITAHLLILLAAPAFCQIEPAQWYFETVPENQRIEEDVAVRNTGGSSLQIAFVSTCPCLSAAPDTITIPPGQTGTVHLAFDPAGYSGSITKSFLLRSSDPELDGLRYPVFGTVTPASAATEQSECVPCAELEEDAARSGSYEATPVYLEYYYSPGCRQCEEFLSKEIPKIVAELGIRLLVNALDINEGTTLEKLRARLSALKTKSSGFPALAIGDHVLQGEREIREGLRDLILREYESLMSGVTSTPDAPNGATLIERIAPFPVLAAGLIDGVNPCAFTALIFLLSYLTLVGRSRREILLIGSLYTVSVFATYFLIGLGLFQALRMASSFPVIASLLRWVLVGVLAVFAVLSLDDARLIHAGRASEMVLQLPDSLKKRIQSTIRKRVKMTAIAGSALVIGFLVSVFELACTGQVYLPTLMYMVRTERQAGSVFLLLLYNLGFILPLLAVFALAYFGVGSQKLARVFQRHMVWVKIALAGVFVLLAVLTVLL